MKSAPIMFSVLFFSGMSRAAVENIVSMQRDASGSFTVTCDTGGLSESTGVTAEAIRSDAVCAPRIGLGSLDEGSYHTPGPFCSQVVRWKGAQLQLVLEAPCTGTLTLDLYKENAYRGHLEGFAHVYEVEVRTRTEYVFYSRDFQTQGEFTRGGPTGPSNHPGGSLDPTRKP